MEKKSNNYIVIIIVLLLVATIITGAGLCYLSWADDFIFTEQNSPGQTTEATDNTASEEDQIGAADTESSSEGDSGIQSTEASSEVTAESSETQPDVSTEAAEPVERKGIDVSKYQQNIDWKKVASDGVEYAFIRVGCRGYGISGTMIKDEKFHQNMQGALAENIDVGAYFFSQAITEAEIEEEADFVIQELKGYEVTYPVAIDIEGVKDAVARQDKLTKEKRTELCKIFCEKIKEAGYIPMIYGDDETFSELLDVKELSEYDFWICQITDKLEFPYEYAVWQYSHTGKVSGIKGNTNLSISYKDWN